MRAATTTTTTALCALALSCAGHLLAGEKTIVNKTDSDVTVTSLTRVGDDAGNSGKSVILDVKAGKAAALSYEEPFLNGVTVSWSAEGSSGVQFERIAKRSAAFDDALNTNRTLTVDAVRFIDADGSNSGADQGKKKLVNKTDKTLRVYLVPRDGDDPANSGKMVGPFQLAPGGSAIVDYDGVFLNGLSINWDNGSDTLAGQSTSVVEKGNAWDATLNTHDTIMFNSVANPAITGSADKVDVPKDPDPAPREPTIRPGNLGSGLVFGVGKPGDAGFKALKPDFGDRIALSTYAPADDSNQDLGLVAGAKYTMLMLTGKDDQQAFVYWQTPDPAFQEILHAKSTKVAGIGGRGFSLQRGDDLTIQAQKNSEGPGTDVTFSFFRGNKSTGSISFIVE